MILMSLNVKEDCYRSSDGFTMMREYDTLTPNGNHMNGRWVLRSSDSTLIDYDAYRHDLIERNHIRFIESDDDSAQPDNPAIQ